MANDVAESINASTPAAVLVVLANDMGDGGFQDHLDHDHTVTFVSRGPNLLVTFETLEHTLNASKNGLPLGMDFVDDKNWSLLHFAAHTESWFRSDALYSFMDNLVDDAFFEDFDQVMFYGSGMGAYAACAFSVAAPGANVMAVAPQATLDTERAGWDMRFPDAKRLKFDDRYGYAPDMVDGANTAFILFDPYLPLDHIHASLFQGSNVERLKCRHFNGLIELALKEMDALHQVIEICASGDLNRESFYKFLRRRRDHNRYLRTLLQTMTRRNRPLHAAMVCKNVLDRKVGGPVFRKTLAACRDTLVKRGKAPEWLMRA